MQEWKFAVWLNKCLNHPVMHMLNTYLMKRSMENNEASDKASGIYSADGHAISWLRYNDHRYRKYSLSLHNYL